MAFDNANQAKGSTGQPASCRPRVLVSERDSRVRIALSRCLETLACEVVATTTAKDALAALEHRPVDHAFVDPPIEIEAGHDLGSRVLDETPETLLVLIVSCTTFGAALPERLRGMCDHLPDVFSPGQVRRLVEAFREEWGLRQQLADCRRHLRAVSFDCGIVAESPAMQATLQDAARAASSDLPIVLCGERGTEHELLARFIHQNSAWSKGPFVMAGPLGPSEESVAAELFGWARNATSGRSRGQPGLVEEAEGGTLFLADLREIPSSGMVLLRRLAQHGDFERVGELRIRQATVRMVAGIHGDEEVSGEWLGNCPDVVRIALPPLRNRTADIVPLADKFVDVFARRMRREAPILTEEARQALVAYDWPGNVPELKNTIERAVMLCRASVIGAGALPECVSSKSDLAPRLGGDFSIAEIEREHIRRVANRATSDLEAAKLLGISRSTLWRRRGAEQQKETIALIREMALLGQSWRPERIREEMRKLGIKVKKRTVQECCEMCAPGEEDKAERRS